MESDLEFMRVRMVDELVIGIFIIDTKEYKETLSAEIRSKISLTKKILKDKFQNCIDSCMSLGEKILAKMSDDPKNVREYIKLN